MYKCNSWLISGILFEWCFGIVLKVRECYILELIDNLLYYGSIFFFIINNNLKDIDL